LFRFFSRALVEQNKIAKKKEVSQENEFVEQPLFDVQIIDTTETKERLDRFEKYAKENNVKLKDF